MASLALIVAISLITILGSTSLALSGFGSAITFQLFWQLLKAAGFEDAGNLEVAQSVLIITQSMTACLVLIQPRYRCARKDILVALVPPSIVAILVGNLILIHVSSSILERSLGCFFFLISLHRYGALLRRAYRETDGDAVGSAARAGSTDSSQSSDEDDDSTAAILSHPVATSDSPAPETMNQVTEYHSTNGVHGFKDTSAGDEEHGTDKQAAADDVLPRTHTGWAPRSCNEGIASAVSGVFAGVLRGTVGTGGPPVMILFSFMTIYKHETRSTSAFAHVLATPFRVAFAIHFGFFEAKNWDLYLAVAACCLLGYAIGNQLHYCVDGETFKMFLVALVALASVPLMQLSDLSVFSLVMLPVVSITVLSLGSLYVYVRCKRRSQQF